MLLDMSQRPVPDSEIFEPHDEFQQISLAKTMGYKGISFAQTSVVVIHDGLMSRQVFA